MNHSRVPGKPYCALAGEVIRVHEITHEVRFSSGAIVTLPTVPVRPPYVGQHVGMILFEPDPEVFELGEPQVER